MQQPHGVSTVRVVTTQRHIAFADCDVNVTVETAVGAYKAAFRAEGDCACSIDSVTCLSLSSGGDVLADVRVTVLQSDTSCTIILDELPAGSDTDTAAAAADTTANAPAPVAEKAVVKDATETANGSDNGELSEGSLLDDLDCYLTQYSDEDADIEEADIRTSSPHKGASTSRASANATATGAAAAAAGSQYNNVYEVPLPPPQQQAFSSKHGMGVDGMVAAAKRGAEQWKHQQPAQGTQQPDWQRLFKAYVPLIDRPFEARGPKHVPAAGQRAGRPLISSTTRTIERYSKVRMLGVGTFGQAWEGKEVESGRRVYIKEVSGAVMEDNGAPAAVLREVQLLRELSHTNIVQLVEVVTGGSTGTADGSGSDSGNANRSGSSSGMAAAGGDDCDDDVKWQKTGASASATAGAAGAAKDRKKGDAFSAEKLKRKELYMIFEYMENDLQGVLEMIPDEMTPYHVRSYMHQFLQGVAYMHQRGVVHFDLKPANLLISRNGTVKISDWSSGCYMKGNMEQDYTDEIVALWYRSPELLMKQVRYGHEPAAIDVWSAGCIFGEMIARTPILQGTDEHSQLDLIFGLCGTPNEDTWPEMVHLGEYTNYKSRFEQAPQASSISATYTELFQPYTPQALQLFEKMLILSPNERLTAVDALEDAYFKSEPLPRAPGQLPPLSKSDCFARRPEQKAEA